MKRFLNPKYIDNRSLRTKIMSDHWDDLAYVARDTKFHSRDYLKDHFIATTLESKKFVYCPIANIASWSIYDYENQWCNYCRDTFSGLITNE